MKVRLKWGKTRIEDRVVTMINLPRVGDYITVRDEELLESRYQVTFIEHLIDDTRPKGIPKSSITVIVWVNVVTRTPPYPVVDASRR